MRLKLFVLCVVSGVLLMSATSAQATRNHVLSASFGSPGEGAGELSLIPAKVEVLLTERNEPVVPGSGVAVDDVTGDVYVADTGNHRVDEFSAGGGFVRAWGWGVADGVAKLETCESVV